MKEQVDFRPGQTILQMIIGSLTAVLLTVLLTVLLSVLLVTKDYRHSLIPVFSWISCGIGVLTGGFLTGYWHRSKGYLVGAVAGLLTVLLLLSVSALAYGGPIGLSGWLKIVLLPLLGMAGGMIGIRVRFHRSER